VNFIKFKGLNCHQLQQLFLNVWMPILGTFIYFSKVRCLRVKCQEDSMICNMKPSHLWNQNENLCQNTKRQKCLTGLQMHGDIQLKGKRAHVSLLGFHKRKTAPISQPHLIPVIAFRQYIHLWTIVFKDEAQEEWNFIKHLWRTPLELTKNCSHCHWTRLMY